jgi:hypothetical protein
MPTVLWLGYVNLSNFFLYAFLFCSCRCHQITTLTPLFLLKETGDTMASLARSVRGCQETERCSRHLAHGFGGPNAENTPQCYMHSAQTLHKTHTHIHTHTHTHTHTYIHTHTQKHTQALRPSGGAWAHADQFRQVAAARSHVVTFASQRPSGTHLLPGIFCAGCAFEVVVRMLACLAYCIL